MHAVHQTGFITTANIEIDGNYPKVPVFFLAYHVYNVSVSWSAYIRQEQNPVL